MIKLLLFFVRRTATDASGVAELNERDVAFWSPRKWRYWSGHPEVGPRLQRRQKATRNNADDGLIGFLGGTTNGEELKFMYGLIFLAGAAAFSWCGMLVLNYWDRTKDPDRLAFVLNISQIPSSVRNLNCNASATTDVIVTCSFEIDPRDFDKVLSGWQFTDKNVLGKRAFYDLEAADGHVWLMGNKEGEVVAERYDE
ncbi:hypothetical protein [Rhizobium sp. BK538]|uniref:hypothetical protein n=1 Tax=Rhizobium sp. BK538 TaxID=2586984 RepID=UPI00161CD7FF|nr:hypothetical protein [Rhizobium sp. BK538]MBB4172023.1 hypothetical protein [Rhizobium sp. BK538]